MLSAELKSELLAIIDRLAELQRQNNEIRRQELEIQDRMAVIQAKDLVAIAFAKDKQDKPLYSNEKIRDAALVAALDEDAEYRSLQGQVRSMEEKRQEVSIEATRLSDRKSLLMFEAGLMPPPAQESSIL